MSTRHASKLDDSRETLCGEAGQLTAPHETVNCPLCRVAMNHVRARYHTEYTDQRFTKEEARAALEGMYRDIVLGEIEG